jgi:hypothetical protein
MSVVFPFSAEGQEEDQELSSGVPFLWVVWIKQEDPPVQVFAVA